MPLSLSVLLLLPLHIILSWFFDLLSAARTNRDTESTQRTTGNLQSNKAGYFWRAVYPPLLLPLPSPYSVLLWSCCSCQLKLQSAASRGHFQLNFIESLIDAPCKRQAGCGMWQCGMHVAHGEWQNRNNCNVIQPIAISQSHCALHN